MTGKEKFHKVMGEFSDGVLFSHNSQVTDRNQAIAIAYSEAQKVEPGFGHSISLEQVHMILADKSVEGLDLSQTKERYGEDGAKVYKLDNEGKSPEEIWLELHEKEHGKKNKLKKNTMKQISDWYHKVYNIVNELLESFSQSEDISKMIARKKTINILSEKGFNEPVQYFAAGETFDFLIKNNFEYLFEENDKINKLKKKTISKTPDWVSQVYDIVNELYHKYSKDKYIDKIVIRKKITNALYEKGFNEPIQYFTAGEIFMSFIENPLFNIMLNNYNQNTMTKKSNKMKSEKRPTKDQLSMLSLDIYNKENGDISNDILNTYYIIGFAGKSTFGVELNEDEANIVLDELKKLISSKEIEKQVEEEDKGKAQLNMKESFIENRDMFIVLNEKGYFELAIAELKEYGEKMPFGHLRKMGGIHVFYYSAKLEDLLDKYNIHHKIYDSKDELLEYLEKQ